MHGPALLAGGAVALLLGATACGRGESPPGSPRYDLDAAGVPRLASSVYIDLTQTRPGGAPQINRISRFRSSLGHDYSDAYECCRSMKHYFMGADASTVVRAPVTGSIVWRDATPSSDQISIAADVEPAFVFTVMHAVLGRTYRVGEHVTEGEMLGYHVGDHTWSDIVVNVDDGKGTAKTCGEGPGGRLVSYFETLTDAAFAVFSSRGVPSRGALVISRAERDAAPIPCVGGRFDPTFSDPLATAVDF